MYLQMKFNNCSFLKITPLNLIITTCFTLLFHTKWSRDFIIYGIILLLAGFFIETIGVETGIIFGNYRYGNTLGIKFLEVPLIIGLNWFLLVYIISTVFFKIRNIYIFALVAAFVMTLLDVLIEPVAIIRLLAVAK